MVLGEAGPAFELRDRDLERDLLDLVSLEVLASPSGVTDLLRLRDLRPFSGEGEAG